MTDENVTNAAQVKRFVYSCFDLCPHMTQEHVRFLTGLVGGRADMVKQLLEGLYRKKYRGAHPCFMRRSTKKSSALKRFAYDESEGLGCCKCRYSCIGCANCGMAQVHKSNLKVRSLALIHTIASQLISRAFAGWRFNPCQV